MTKKWKITIIILVLIIIALIASIIIIYTKKPTSKTPVDSNDRQLKFKENYRKKLNGTYENTNKRIKEDHSANGITIKNMKLHTKPSENDITYYEFEILNETNNTYKNYVMSITFLFEDSTKSVDYSVIINNLEPNKSEKISSTAGHNIVDASDYKFKLQHELSSSSYGLG